METEALNTALAALISKKDELSKIGYDDARYDDLEEELHDMEDTFNEKYGDYMEQVLEEVHTKIAPDTDVLLPTAYLPGSMDALVESAKTKKNNVHGSGVWVDAEEHPGKDARLVLLANPPRLVLSVGKNQKEVWKA